MQNFLVNLPLWTQPFVSRNSTQPPEEKDATAALLYAIYFPIKYDVGQKYLIHML
jgi:hypothetical protein